MKLQNEAWIQPQLIQKERMWIFILKWPSIWGNGWSRIAGLKKMSYASKCFKVGLICHYKSHALYVS